MICRPEETTGFPSAGASSPIFPGFPLRGNADIRGEGSTPPPPDHQSDDPGGSQPSSERGCSTPRTAKVVRGARPPRPAGSCSLKTFIQRAVRQHMVRMKHARFFHLISYAGPRITPTIFLDPLLIQPALLIISLERADLEPFAGSLHFHCRSVHLVWSLIIPSASWPRIWGN